MKIKSNKFMYNKIIKSKNTRHKRKSQLKSNKIKNNLNKQLHNTTRNNTQKLTEVNINHQCYLKKINTIQKKRNNKNHKIKTLIKKMKMYLLNLELLSKKMMIKKIKINNECFYFEKFVIFPLSLFLSKTIFFLILDIKM